MTTSAYQTARDAITDLAHANKSPTPLIKQALSALDDLYWDGQAVQQQQQQQQHKRRSA